MGVFEDTITKAKELIGQAGKATEELIDVQKLKLELSSLKSAMTKNFQALGEAVYSAEKDGEDNAEKRTSIIADIAEQKCKIANLEKEIALAKGQKICDCGALNIADAKYCINCGKEI